MSKVFFLLRAFFLIVAAKDLQGSSIDENSSDFNAALSLERPFIRVPLCDYIKQIKSPKLILGEGHIINQESLATEFRSGGDQELTESMVDFLDPFKFHKNEGYYTASAELCKNFNSDWCGNLTNPVHRESLFIPNTFDLIFDATYTSGVVSEELFNDISKSLRSGGIFIIPLYVSEEEGFFMCGYIGEPHPMDWYSRKIQFNSLEKVYEYWKDFLISRGFACVSFDKSPVTVVLEKHFQEGLISREKRKDLDEEYFKVAWKSLKTPTADMQKLSDAAQIDSHLAHYRLGTHYLIAKK